MRFPLRVFVFLLIALTVVVRLNHYSKLSFLKDPLLKTLSNSLGRTVDASQLTVELGAEIGTEIVVTITDLQIAPPAWQSSAQFVVVPRAQIKARIAELLESPPRLHSIEITSPTITLINDDLNGGNVSRRALGVGTATETRYRRIDHFNAVVDPSANIGQCLSVGVMQVQRKPLVP